MVCEKDSWNGRPVRMLRLYLEANLVFSNGWIQPLMTELLDKMQYQAGKDYCAHIAINVLLDWAVTL